MYFEDFQEGSEFLTPGRTVTETDIVNFAGVSGDFTSIHLDETVAKSSPFGTRIAHGVLTLSIVTGFWWRLGITDHVVAFYGIDKLRFTRPVRPGDTIRARIRVVGRERRERFGLVTLAHEVLNQEGEAVLVFDAKLAVKYREG